MRAWLLLLVLLIPSVHAHATAFETDPPQLTGLPEAPETIRIKFTERLSFDQSFIGIFDEELLRRDSGNASLDPQDQTVVFVHTGNLIDGIYTISYETRSADDGHLYRGSLPLTINVPCTTCLDAESGPGTLAQEDVAWTESLLRAIAYISLALASGAILLRIHAGVDDPTLTRGQLWSGLAYGGVTLAVAWPLIQIIDGMGAWWLAMRVLPIGFILWGAGRKGSPWVAAAAVAVSAWGLVGTGHGGRALSWLFVQWAHTLVLLAWLGGVAWLGWLSVQKGAAWRQFSRFATVGVAVLAISGTILASERLRGPGDLFATSYGQVLFIKIVLAGIIVAFGAWNHRRVWGPARERPGFEPRASSLRHGARWEAIPAALLLLSTGVLAGLPLPVDAPEPPGFVVQSEWWGDYLVRLEVGPTTPSGNLLPGDHIQRVRILDRQEAPVLGAHVELLFTNRVLDVGAIQSPAKELGGGWYEVRGTQLGAVGDWEVEVQFQTTGNQHVREARFIVDLGRVGHVHGGVRITDPHFDTGYLDQGAVYTQAFAEHTVGRFEYHCHPHQWMTGEIFVDPNATAAGTVQVKMYGDAGDEPAAMYFEPATLRIAPGTVVEFVNIGDIPHTATNVQWYDGVTG